MTETSAVAVTADPTVTTEDVVPTTTPLATPATVAPAVAPVATPTEAPAAWDGNVETLPDGAQKLIKELRTESAKRRTDAAGADERQQEMARALAKAAGIELPGDASAPSVEDLTASLANSQEVGTATAIELAVYRTANDHGGNPASLTDSRAFLAKVAELDPKAEDFTTQVTAAAKAAVTANPSLKAAQVAGTSAVEHAGGSGELATTAEQFKSMSTAAKNELFKKNPTLYSQLTGR